MRTIFSKSSRFLLDFVFPPHCVSCKAANHWLCPVCLSRIAFIHEPFCKRCGIPVESDKVKLAQSCPHHNLQFIDGIRSAAYFDHTPIRPAIHAFKYNNHRALSAALGQILADAYRRYHLRAEIVAPVPLHRLRARERGFNQSELLARALSQILGLPLNTTTLQRVGQTRSQVDLTAAERQQNVGDAFACRDRGLAKLRVLLVDDVCTTGATLDACAAALHRGGATSSWGLTLTRAIIDLA